MERLKIATLAGLLLFPDSRPMPPTEATVRAPRLPIERLIFNPKAVCDLTHERSSQVMEDGVCWEDDLYSI